MGKEPRYKILHKTVLSAKIYKCNSMPVLTNSMKYFKVFNHAIQLLNLYSTVHDNKLISVAALSFSNGGVIYNIHL